MPKKRLKKKTTESEKFGAIFTSPRKQGDESTNPIPTVHKILKSRPFAGYGNPGKANKEKKGK